MKIWTKQPEMEGSRKKLKSCGGKAVEEKSKLTESYFGSKIFHKYHETQTIFVVL